MKHLNIIMLPIIGTAFFFLSAPLFGADSISAHFEKTARALNTVIINEINYNSLQSFDSGDWVELYNPSDAPADISGWVFKDSNDDNSFVIPVGSVIPASGYFMIVNDAAKYLDRFKKAVLYTGNFGFGLSSAGEKIRLYDASGNIIDTVTYGAEGGWPAGPDGGGTTLSLRNPFLDNALAANWTSSISYGTPGEENDVLINDIIVINEINYNSPETFNPEDWVEFYNRYDISVDISGWIFKDAEDIYTFVFPDNTVIAPGEFFIACRDTMLFKQAFGDVENIFGNFEFGLSGGGENIYLYDAYGNIIDEVYYNDVPPWPVDADGKGTTLSLTNYSFDNLHSDNWVSSLGTGTPGKVNDVFSGGTVIINEINYNSFTMDSDDWVELYNSHDRTIDLSGWVLKDDNETHVFIFPAGTYVGPEDYLVICSNALKFFEIFPKVKNYIGDIGFGLGNYGDKVRIYNAEGVLVDSLTYSNGEPWPAGADGTGHTLELLNPSYDNALPENWAGSFEYGTPGKRNSVYAWEPSLYDVYYLGQNYPNPFKVMTTIPVYVSVESRVTVEIYSILGRRVAKPVDQIMLPGDYNIIFTPENLLSGSYIYTLKAGKFTKSKLMMYLK